MSSLPTMAGQDRAAARRPHRTVGQETVAQEWEMLVSRLERLDACAVSDALDRLGLPGATTGLRPITVQGRVVAGRVLTVGVGPRQDDRPAPHLATQAVEAGGPGEVIVVDNDGRTDVSSWGGILSHAAQGKGVRGVVVDGACRDVDESSALGFPIFARAAVPVTARGRIVQRSFNEPIKCAGVRACPGDLVIADGSGVVFIPAGRADEVLSTAEAIASLEAAMTAAVRAGRPVTEVMHDTSFQTDAGSGRT